jgi:predicted nucleic acid-binding Zn ribbon protein
MGSCKWVSPGELLPALLQRLKEQEVSPLHKVLEIWEGVVGQDVARHASPLGLRKHTLHVVVDSSVWAAELSGFHRGRILNALNKALGRVEIEQLRFTTKASMGRGSPADPQQMGNADEV